MLEMGRVCQKLCAELHANCAAKDNCNLDNARVGGRYKRALSNVLSSFGEVAGQDVAADIKKYSRRCDDRMSLTISELRDSQDILLLGKSKERHVKSVIIVVSSHG